MASESSDTLGNLRNLFIAVVPRYYRMGFLGLGDDDSDSDSGGRCTSHHWGQYSIDWFHSSIEQETTTIEGEQVEYLKISTTKAATCQHDGCTVRNSRSGNTFYVPGPAIASIEDDMPAIWKATKALYEDTDDDGDDNDEDGWFDPEPPTDE